jgi:hypothetical protein
MFGAKTVLAGLRLLGNPLQGRNALNKELRQKQVFINLLVENVFQNPLILRQLTRPLSVSLVPHTDPGEVELISTRHLFKKHYQFRKSLRNLRLRLL